VPSHQSKENLDLPTRIIALLEKGRPLLAREIAAALNRQRGVSVTRKIVNQCLYGSGTRECFQQDDKYRWSLRLGASNNVREQLLLPLE